VIIRHSASKSLAAWSCYCKPHPHNDTWSHSNVAGKLIDIGSSRLLIAECPDRGLVEHKPYVVFLDLERE